MCLAEKVNRVTHQIIGAGIRIHRRLGPGLLESAYQPCFAWELKDRQLRFVAQQWVPLVYGDVRLERCYRLDFLVEDLVVVEIKALDRLSPIHRAQMLTYLRLTGCPVGLVLNFGAAVMKAGVMRVANNFPEWEDAEKIEDADMIEDAEKIEDDETRRRRDAGINLGLVQQRPDRSSRRDEKGRGETNEST